MKTAEELTALKEEVESINKKLAELTDEKLTQVSSGYPVNPCLMCHGREWSCNTCPYFNPPRR